MNSLESEILMLKSHRMGDIDLPFLVKEDLVSKEAALLFLKELGVKDPESSLEVENE